MRERVAVIGAGPAGLWTAHHLRGLGVTNTVIFERQTKLMQRCRGCMLCIMRTTITLDDPLGLALKERARREGVSLSALIARLLRDAATQQPTRPNEPPLSLVTVGGAPSPHVDLDRTSELLTADDEATFRVR